MRNALLLVLLTLFIGPTAIHSQSLINIGPSQCVWQGGDNPAWAAPNLDQSDWQPWHSWKPDFERPHLWVRCHADLSSLRGQPAPAIQVVSHSPYQLYVNGILVGAEGHLRTGNASLDATRSYPIPASALDSPSTTVALRLSWRVILSITGAYAATVSAPLQIRAGDSSILDGIRARATLSQARRFGPLAVSYGIVGVLAAVLLGLYFYDRSRLELLLLSLACFCLALLRINEFAAAVGAGYSVSTGLVFVGLGNIGLTVSEIPFFFTLARRRLPRWMVVLLAVMAVVYLPICFDAFHALHQSRWMESFQTDFIRAFELVSHFGVSFVPLFVFGSWRKLAPRMRPLAALCALWGTADILWFAVEFSGIHTVSEIPNLFVRWALTALAARAFTLACVLAALLALLFREQRQVTEERALLSGELQAAREIQKMLVPAEMESTHSLRLQAAFYPMREVGGDFYQAFRRDDNSMLLVIGDVSGKGLRAAMTGTLAVGVVRTLVSENLSPAALLTRMNRELVATMKDGFITCLCLLIFEDGRVTAANAGHLAPYLNGKEVDCPPGLPVGIVAESFYDETSFTLNHGDTLTLLSDGVLEARKTTGELFGFERTASIATLPAEAIARAAQQFGQEDDITVLTLTFSPAEAVHA